MANDISKIKTPDNTVHDIRSYRTAAIPMGTVDSTSTSTAYTATVPGITSLYDGVCVWLTNGVITSASGCTLDINGLGAKPMYYSLSAASALTTHFQKAYTDLFVYNSTRVSGGCWDLVAGFNSTYSPVSLGIGYATCATAESTVAKTATLSSYQLTTNGIVSVKFTNAVPANSTLNINSKGAKSIFYRGAAITDGIIKAGDIATFIYSTNYILLAIDRNCEVDKALYDLCYLLDPDEGETYDLDDLPPGRYRISTTAAAGRVLNGPTTEAGYMVICEQTSADVYKRQIAIRAMSANDGDYFYVRHYRGSSSGAYHGWSEWYIYKGDAVGATPAYLADIYGRGTAIPQGTTANPVSLNDYVDVGTYYCSSTAIASSLSNVPGTAGPFRLEVKHYIATSTVLQTLYKTTEPEKMYVRKKQSNAWTSWYVFTGTAVT